MGVWKVSFNRNYLKIRKMKIWLYVEVCILFFFIEKVAPDGDIFVIFEQDKKQDTIYCGYNCFRLYKV